MKKTITSVSDLVEQIQKELSDRSVMLDEREDEVKTREDAIPAQRASLELDIASFEKEKADFEPLRSEVDGKFNKIRADEKLSKDIIAQALEAKQIEKNLRDIREERMLTDIQLEEMTKREVALSKREQESEDAFKKDLVDKLFKR